MCAIAVLGREPFTGTDYPLDWGLFCNFSKCWTIRGGGSLSIEKFKSIMLPERTFLGCEFYYLTKAFRLLGLPGVSLIEAAELE